MLNDIINIMDELDMAMEEDYKNKWLYLRQYLEDRLVTILNESIDLKVLSEINILNK